MSIWLRCVLLLTAVGALGAGPPSVDEEVENCARENLPVRSVVQTLRLLATDRVGEVRETRAEIFWRKRDDGASDSLLVFSAPPEMRGTRLLYLERDGKHQLFMYSEELKRTRRITGDMMGKIAGTDIGYGDLEHVLGLSDRIGSERLADSRIGETPVYVLAFHSDPADSHGIDRTVAYLDRNGCVPLVQEFYEPGGRLRRVMRVDAAQIREEPADGRMLRIPRRSVVADVRDGTQTEVLIEKLEIDVSLPRKLFSQRELDRGH